VQIDLDKLPDDPAVLQQILREVVPELLAENEKMWQLIQRMLRHRFGPRSEQIDLDQLQLALEDQEQDAAEHEAGRGRGSAIPGAAADEAGPPQSRCPAGTFTAI
jgi:transposase